MSATKTRLVVASKTRRRRPATSQPSIDDTLWAEPLPQLVLERPAAPPPVVSQESARATRGRTGSDWFLEAEHARAERLRPLWDMSPRQRVDAMRRGELSYEQLTAWSARHPEQIPTLNGEFEWIAAKTPEVCE